MTVFYGDRVSLDSVQRYLNNTHPKDVCKFVCDDMTPSTERDSGLGRTEDGSLKQDEGSEQVRELMIYDVFGTCKMNIVGLHELD